MQIPDFYLRRLREDFNARLSQNPSYSIHDFAQDLNLSSDTLSKILNGDRPFLLKEKGLMNSISLSEDNRLELHESHHKIIAEWEHFAVLELFHIKDFKCTADEVSVRLNISSSRATVVLNNLMKSWFIRINDEGRLERTYDGMKTTEDIPSECIRSSHAETLILAGERLHQVDVKQRDYSSTTMAINPEKLPEAKALIREFRQKMTALLQEGEMSQVYKLSIQLFPLVPGDQE